MATTGAGGAIRWSESRQAAVVLAISYAVLAMPPVLYGIHEVVEGESGLIHGLGKAAGLLGLTLLALQSVLTSRIRLVERPFGYDRLTRFHRTMAIVAAVLVLLHPVLIAAGIGAWGIFSPGAGTPIALGKVALALLVLVVVGALGFRRLGVDYRTWRLLHRGTPVVGVLGLAHAMLVSHHIRLTSPVGLYMALLLAGALGIWVWRNAVVPRWGRREYTVESVAKESHNTWALALTPVLGRSLSFRPGQFTFLRLLRAGMRTEEHPFTISSSPTDTPGLTMTIKESGDYTRTIGRTRPGDRAVLEAPFGRFSFTYHPACAYLFVAGGVGVTPIMSMLRFMRVTGDRRPARLICANRAERDILFRSELEAMPENVRVLHILSDAGGDWAGERGHVSARLIREFAGDELGEAEVFVCCPPPMVAAVRGALTECGVPRRRVHTERFAL